MALIWTKTETGYTAGDYKLTKTPGKRWFVEHKNLLLEDGKQFRKLAEAQALAEDHAEAEREYAAKIVADAKDIAATLTPEQAKAGMAEVMGVEHRADPTPTTESVPLPSETAACRRHQSAEGTATLPDVVTVSNSFSGSQDAVRVAIAADVKFLKAHPRESLNDQFTRLEVYRDIGIVRRFRRDVA